MEIYYIITSQKKKKVLATKDLEQVYDFIVKNKDVKIKTVDYTGKPKSMNRIVFLKKYYELCDNKNKLFDIVPLLIKGRSNVWRFLEASGMYEEYKIYKDSTENTL